MVLLQIEDLFLIDSSYLQGSTCMCRRPLAICYYHLILPFPFHSSSSFFLKIPFSRVLESSVSSHELVLIFVFFYLQLHDCYYWAVLWISVSKTNQEERGWCYSFHNNLTIYLFLPLAHLPRTCDDVHRHKTFVLWMFSLFYPLLLNVHSFHCPIVVFIFYVAWLERVHAHFFLFLLHKQLRKGALKLEMSIMFTTFFLLNLSLFILLCTQFVNNQNGNISFVSCFLIYDIETFN